MLHHPHRRRPRQWLRHKAASRCSWDNAARFVTWGSSAPCMTPPPLLCAPPVRPWSARDCSLGWRWRRGALGSGTRCAAACTRRARSPAPSSARSRRATTCMRSSWPERCLHSTRAPLTRSPPHAARRGARLCPRLRRRVWTPMGARTARSSSCRCCRSSRPPHRSCSRLVGWGGVVDRAQVG